jgi:hypothetical protein
LEIPRLFLETADFKKLHAKYADDPKALTILDKEQREIEMYKKYYKWYGSAFFVMQKR